MSGRDITKLHESDVDKLFNEPFLVVAAKNNISTIQFLGKIITEIERSVKSHVKLSPEFNSLLTIQGIGTILGLTIMLEVGDMQRFPKWVTIHRIAGM